MIKNISLLLNRIVENDNYTLGLLRQIGTGVISTTLENGLLQKRIPSGTYEVKLKKVITPLTEKYRRKFVWFSWHLDIKNIQNGNNVYIHVGNNETDTDLCLLVANTLDLTPPNKHGFIGESTNNFKKLYLKLSEQLEEGGKVFLTVIDK